MSILPQSKKILKSLTIGSVIGNCSLHYWLNMKEGTLCLESDTDDTNETLYLYSSTKSSWYLQWSHFLTLSLCVKNSEDCENTGWLQIYR